MSQFIEMFGDPIKNSKKLPTRKGEELFVFSSGKANTKSNLSNDFPFNCYGGNGITGHSDQWLIDYPTIVIGRVGEYFGCVHKTHGKVWITDNAIYIKEHKEKVFNETFLFYLMTYLDFHRLADETGQPKITQRPLLTMDYVIPAKDLQEQFVAIAHQADKSEFGDIKSQFIEMFNGEFPKERWEECLTITNGKKYDGEYQETGTYPICGSGGIMGYGEQKLCPKDTVILGRKGNINSPIYMESDYWIVDTAFCLDVDKQKLQPKFFFYWCILFDFTRYNKQGVLPSLTKNDLLKIDIPIPPMDLQTKFVNIQEQADKSESECHLSINDLNNSINYN